MKFRFTISDLGILLGKSPVTIRAWERKGLMRLPRVGSTRSLTLDEVQTAARLAARAGRISQERLMHITEALNILEWFEREKH